MGSLTTTQKQLREEEEKKFLANEKETTEKERFDFAKEKRTISNGVPKAPGYDKFSRGRGTPDGKVRGVIKTGSQSKFKKSLKKSKATASKPTTKAKKIEKPKKK